MAATHSTTNLLSSDRSNRIAADGEAEALESGQAGPRGHIGSAGNGQENVPLWRQSRYVSPYRLAVSILTGEDPYSHPIALFFLFFFRTLAIATYLLCGFFSNSYVLSVSTVRSVSRNVPCFMHALSDPAPRR
jgi:Eukaryotic protein of unknown function (DUF846)